MAYYRDLDRCTYIDRNMPPSLDLSAVGWLEAAYPYQRGSVPPEFVDRLFELLESVWDPIRFRGGHACDLCSFGPQELRNEAGRVADVGAKNLLIPKHGDTGLFVAPSLILHYVISHSYCPPSEFQEAVMACPGTESSAYFHRVGRIVPETDKWRSGLFGYWQSMGAAIAKEHGLMSQSQWSTCFSLFNKGRYSFSARDLAPEAPGWFAEQYLAPLDRLAERLENQGKTEDARAVREWMSSAQFLGRCAPSQPGGPD